jgi:hypothetical protein
MQLGYKNLAMREIFSECDYPSIQWVNKSEDKYFVKFEEIDIPIEMNDKYYKSVLKHLEN